MMMMLIIQRRLLIILSVIVYYLCFSFRTYNHHHHRYYFKFSTLFPLYSNINQNDNTNSVTNNYKLPIIQIIVKQELVGELFYDNENNKELFISKLKAIIKQQQTNKNKVDDDKIDNTTNSNISGDKANDADLYNNSMKSIMNIDSKSSSSERHNTIYNIYTDDMLMKSLNKNYNNDDDNNKKNKNNDDSSDNDDDDGKIIILKIYNDICRRCVDIESIYIDIISSLDKDDFYCIQARSIDIPSYMQKISHRLLGLKKSIAVSSSSSSTAAATTSSASSMMIKTMSSTTAKVDDNDDDNPDSSISSGSSMEAIYDLICNTCNNSGRIDCIDCNGKGYVMKGSIASYCSTCCGQKVIRCDICGGKCLNC